MFPDGGIERFIMAFVNVTMAAISNDTPSDPCTGDRPFCAVNPYLEAYAKW